MTKSKFRIFIAYGYLNIKAIEHYDFPNGNSIMN